ncbi:MAG: nuclear transport factor 2 family protein [Bacteroidota bacterium]
MNRNLALAFVDAINSHNTDNICTLMTPNHLFIDSQGNEFEGKEFMKQAWKSYFEMFPDYRIEISRVVENDSNIVLLGSAQGTYKNMKSDDNSMHWKVPAAFRAESSKNKIKLWQVYADNTFAFNIMNKHHD